ncbi:MAG: hypothetical protein Q7R70_07000 [Candidatus Diapherotrites archaeon]|nr:hypothetical protein [Candidatus Diapherotrites archaeon]
MLLIAALISAGCVEMNEMKSLEIIEFYSDGVFDEHYSNKASEHFILEKNGKLGFNAYIWGTPIELNHNDSYDWNVEESTRKPVFEKVEKILNDKNYFVDFRILQENETINHGEGSYVLTYKIGGNYQTAFVIAIEETNSFKELDKILRPLMSSFAKKRKPFNFR